MHTKYQSNPKSRTMFENRKQHFFEIFQNTVLGNIAKMKCNKYQFNRKTRSMLNRVPNSAQCETRSKFVRDQIGKWVSVQN